MIVKLTRPAMLDTKLRIYMFAKLRKDNIKFWQQDGVINFVYPDEYKFMLSLGSTTVKEQIAKELGIIPEALQ